MTLWTKFLLIGAGAGGYAMYRRSRGNVALGADGDRGFVPSSSVRDIATKSGISDVDPEPLSQMVEAQDPEATEAAHTTLPELHDRLP